MWLSWGKDRGSDGLCVASRSIKRMYILYVRVCVCGEGTQEEGHLNENVQISQRKG